MATGASTSLKQTALRKIYSLMKTERDCKRSKICVCMLYKMCQTLFQGGHEAPLHWRNICEKEISNRW